MQKKLIALAVAGLMSGAAFAQTSVTIGGKFDLGYQFVRKTGSDSAAGVQNPAKGGGTTTESQSDGAGSSSRITIQAKEQFAPGYSAMVDLDLRFTNISEGKNNTSSTGSGLSSNDKKDLQITTPFGQLIGGVRNMALDDFFLAEKPIMNSPDTELVKQGILTTRLPGMLTNRSLHVQSPVLQLGPVGFLAKGSYAIGGNRADGSSGDDGQGTTTHTNSGDAAAGGLEWKALVGGVNINGGFNVMQRYTTTLVKDAETGMNVKRYFISAHPIKPLKLAVDYYTIRGYSGAWSAAQGSAYKEKSINLVAMYNITDAWRVAASRSHVNDLGSNRNSGKGFMMGTDYRVSKSTWLYAGFQKADWARNEDSDAGTCGAYAGDVNSGGYFDPAKNANSATTSFCKKASKADKRQVEIGIVKEF